MSQLLLPVHLQLMVCCPSFFTYLGLSVACATVAGTIGILDVKDQSYSIIQRGHTGQVLAVACDPVK